jgi:branched-chain amino acid transport system ATP-binding protein
MLTIDNLVVRHGMAVALDGVSMNVETGEMVALVGPNGAGKSSIVNAVSGLVPIASGTITLSGRAAQVPEGRQMFADMTVDDNLSLGAWSIRDRDLAPIYELLPDLARLRKRIAGTLSGGQQQMVAVGRALMAKPDILLIDELSLGLAPLIVADLADHLRSLNREKGTTILLIEQEIGLAFDLCERAYVLEAGQIVASGKSDELRSDPTLRDAYFGREAEETAKPIAEEHR